MSAKPEKLIAALLAAPSLAEACRQVGVCEKTGRRWLADPDFKRQYAEAREAAFDRTLARLQAVSGEAVDTLAEAMRSGTPGGKIRAALGLLRLAVDCRLTDIADKLAELERAVGNLQNGETRI